MMQIDPRSDLAGMIRDHIRAREEREIMLLDLMAGMLDLMKTLRAYLPGADAEEERPRPN